MGRMDLDPQRTRWWLGRCQRWGRGWPPATLQELGAHGNNDLGRGVGVGVGSGPEWPRRLGGWGDGELSTGARGDTGVVALW
ncbi:putative basic proline-rich protein-like [Iris pallida]|uniref:Basic proline-rich protein-like n=1 Tax=Iris pallida TaxID=29817 RepID=A0AAX6H066_IRIPA|nr:putative basic proline-rich protein-like [Iris pallida]